tara:strand:+ start:52 stop:495 length:444 start_codon:yes stop_codon:yes gene_type:complete
MPSTKKVDKRKRVYTKEQKDNRAIKHKIWASNNKEKVAIYLKAWRIQNALYMKDQQIQYRQDKKEAVYKFLGNKCKNCRENDPIYFQIDHVKNDGNLERNGSDKTHIHSLKKYLENPERFQLLCANCNWAKRMNGGKLYKPKKRRQK